jgi:hypothetical protein
VSWFSRIESSCAAFIERAFAKTFPSDLEPAQIARKLVATMEAATRGGDDGLIAPGNYVVYVNPEDLERLKPHGAYLEREWSQLLIDMASRVDIAFSDGGVQIVLQPRESIPAGAVEIEPGSLEQTERIAFARPEKAIARFQLRMVKGVPAYGVYAIDRSLHVGRSDDSELFLVDPSVSRRHAVIDVDSGWPIVHDLGSTNGTFVNGERIETRRLAPGDLVTFGKTELRLEGGGAA